MLHSAIRSRFPPLSSFLFLSEWLLLVIPLLLSMTLFAERPGTLSAALLLPAVTISILFPPRQSGTPLPFGGAVSPRVSPAPGSDDKTPQQRTTSTEVSETTRLSALSTYRAHMMLVTMLAILAVDFPVFPRALAKCETYGVSFVRPVFLSSLSYLQPFMMLTSESRWTWALVHSYFPKELPPRPQSSNSSNIRRI
jgi:phosphatidylinositol glycan class W